MGKNRMNRQRPASRAVAIALVLLAAGAFSGCATTPIDPEDRSEYDPFEPLNRQIFAFNMAADRLVLRPITLGYDRVVPGPVKSGFANFFDNLATPVWVLNHLLQGEFREAGRQSGRFVLNTTGGILGFIDVARKGGIEKRKANFDQTFGRWGVPSGPYLMLPLIGPSTPRDSVGMYARYRTDVLWNELDHNKSLRDKLMGVRILEIRRELLPLDRTLERAPDPYILVREGYRQGVEYDIRGPGSDDDDVGLDFEDEWDDDEDW
jgi:phospholipid-binding lipoprotein MlaA